jgi:hypothetical protein
MKKTSILLGLLLVGGLLFGQSAQLTYNYVEVINGKDTILLDNEGLITFTKGTMIMQNTDKRINTFLVPGSEFDKLGVMVFDDTNKMIHEDSISKTIVYSSINHSAEIGVKISTSIKDSLIIMKKNMDMVIFTNLLV